MDPRMDLLVKRLTWAATGVVVVMCITADYGPDPHAFTPIKQAWKSMKDWFWTPSEKELEEIERRRRFWSEHDDNTRK